MIKCDLNYVNCLLSELFSKSNMNSVKNAIKLHVQYKITILMVSLEYISEMMILNTTILLKICFR